MLFGWWCIRRRCSLWVIKLNSINNLKTIFVIEDNKISQSTDTSEVLSGNFEEKFKAFNIQYFKVEINSLIDLDQIDKALNFVDKHSSQLQFILLQIDYPHTVKVMIPEPKNT